MPSKYTHRLTFFESWLADLEDASKEFSANEKWQVVKAAFDCQLTGDVTPLLELPLSIRRALSLPTMSEQLRTIIDKAAGASDRAAQAAAAKRAASERKQATERANHDAQEKAKADHDAQEKAKADKEREDAFNAKMEQFLGGGLHHALRQSFKGRDYLSAVWSLAVAGHAGARQYMPNWDKRDDLEMLNISQYLNL